MSVKPMAGLDMDNRDPNNLGEHIQVMWDDVIGEPEGIRSTDCAWNLSHKCFSGSKHYCYLILSTLFGPCVALCTGLNMACLAFQHIWCFVPTLRACKINCAFVRVLMQVCLAGCCGPWAEACGLYFAKIKVRYQRVPDGDDKDILVV